MPRHRKHQRQPATAVLNPDLDMAAGRSLVRRHAGRAVHLRRPCGRYTLAPGERWFCAQTHPRQEYHAVYELQSSGYHPLLLLFIDYGRHERQYETMIRPLFPGYLFLPLDLSLGGWVDARYCRGVKRLMARGDGSPIPLPTGVVEELQTRGRDDGVIDDKVIVERLPPIPTGSSLRVLEGPFTSFTGICQLDDGGRVTALLSLFGREVPAELDRVAVELI